MKIRNRITFSSLIAFMGVACASFGVQAQSIAFNGGVIEYEKGTMDLDTYNGTIEGITFRSHRGETASADSLTIKTTPGAEGEGDSFTIDQFIIKNLIAEDDGKILKIASLSVEDALIEGAAVKDLALDDVEEEVSISSGNIELSGLSLTDEDSGSLAIESFSISGYAIGADGFGDLPSGEGLISMSGFTMTREDVGTMTIESIRMVALPADIEGLDDDDANFFSDVALAVKNMILIPAGGDSHRIDLSKYGLDQVEINIQSTIHSTDKADRVDTLMEFGLDARDLGNIGLSVDIGVLKSVLPILMGYYENPDDYDDDKMMALILPNAFFNNAEVTVDDNGILDILFAEMEESRGMTRAEIVTQTVENIGLSFGDSMPQTFSAFAPAIRGFLLDGNTISLKMRPESPVPLATFPIFAAAPDEARSILGAELSTKP